MVRKRVVFFDLETTGFDGPVRPVQIGAVDSWGRRIFKCYVNPGRNIHPKATKVNGFEMVKGELHRNGRLVRSYSLREALARFHHFLRSLRCKIILVAHNVSYDRRVLLEAAADVGLYAELTGIIFGFSDSLAASKLTYPKSGSHKLPDMLDLLGLYRRETHDAVADAFDCRKICRCMAWKERRPFMKFIMDRDWFTPMERIPY